MNRSPSLASFGAPLMRIAIWLNLRVNQLYAIAARPGPTLWTPSDPSHDLDQLRILSQLEILSEYCRCNRSRKPGWSEVGHYAGITPMFSAGIFLIAFSSRFRCDVTISGGRCLSQLFSEKSMNWFALNISRYTRSVFPVFSM